MVKERSKRYKKCESPECEDSRGVRSSSDLQEIGKQGMRWIRASTSGLEP